MALPEGYTEHYIIKEPGKDPQEVGKARFIRAEGAAGFYPKAEGEVATGGFSDSRSGIEGTIAYTDEQVKKALARLRGEKIE